MNFSIKFDTFRSGWSIEYIERSKVIISKKSYISFSEDQLRSAVGNVSGYRCVSDCRFRGREFDPGPVPYFRGD